MANTGTVTIQEALKSVQSGLTAQDGPTTGQKLMGFDATGNPVAQLPASYEEPTPAGGTGSVVFTLEQTSNPQFAFQQAGSAAAMYEAAMGGYLFLQSGGKVYAAKLSSASWDKLADGTPVTAELEQQTETMIHVPDCHFKGDGKTMTFGGLTPVIGGHVFDSPHWGGAYKISLAGGKAHSRPDVAPQHTRTMTQFWQDAQALGSEFGLANYGFHCLINALYQARYGNLNSQAVIGEGFNTEGGTEEMWQAARDVPMGLLKSLGDGSGKVYYTDATIGDQYPVKLFGFEDLWGKLWEFRPGIRFEMRDSIRYAIVYPGNVVSNTAEGREFVLALKASSSTNGFVSRMELGEWWDMIAQAVKGSDSTYYADGFYYRDSGQLLYVGGHASGGSLCGLACSISLIAFSHSPASIGARLAFYGEPKIVSGAELAALAAA